MKVAPCRQKTQQMQKNTSGKAAWAMFGLERLSGADGGMRYFMRSHVRDPKGTPTIHRGSVEALTPSALTAEVCHRERAHVRTARTGRRAGVENPRP